MPLRNLLSILTTPKMLFTTSMRNIPGNHNKGIISMNTLRLTEICQMKEKGNVTVLIHMHICRSSISDTPKLPHTWKLLHIWKLPQTWKFPCAWKFLHVTLFADKSYAWMSQHLPLLSI